LAPQKKAATPSTDGTDWLEQELNQAKLHIKKLETQLEQTMAQVWDVTNAWRRLEENVSNSAVATASVQTLQEEVRNLKEGLDRLRDRQAEIAGRGEDTARQRQGDVGREHQERGILSRQVEGMEKLVAAYEGRAQAMEEAIRHREDDAASLRQSQVNLNRQLDELVAKSGIEQEAITRLVNSQEKVNVEIEGLRKLDEALAERLRLQQELLRRLEDRLEQANQNLELLGQIAEGQERLAFELGRMGERAALLERATEESTERTVDFVQGMRLLDQRLQQQTEKLLTLNHELDLHREQVTEQLAKVVRLLERQKRREAEALSLEIKEIRQSDLGNAGE